jgi:hypothetical protein
MKEGRRMVFFKDWMEDGKDGMWKDGKIPIF